MAKNESTAVNELIELASTKALRHDDSGNSHVAGHADLADEPLFREPRPSRGPHPVAAVSTIPATPSIPSIPSIAIASSAASETATTQPRARQRESARFSAPLASVRVPELTPLSRMRAPTGTRNDLGSPSQQLETSPMRLTRVSVPHRDPAVPQVAAIAPTPVRVASLPVPSTTARTSHARPTFTVRPAATAPSPSPSQASPYTTQQGLGGGWTPPASEADLSPPPVRRSAGVTPRTSSARTSARAVSRDSREAAEDAWFEPSRDERLDEMQLNTLQVARQPAPNWLSSRFALPLIGATVLGILIGGYAVVSHSKPPVVATAPAAAPASAPAPAVAAAPPAAVAVPAPLAPTPAPAPAAAPVAVPAVAVPPPIPVQGVSLVEVRIDSQPSGATVMLVDRGKSAFLGTTPVSASVDSSRTYDVVLTLESRPTVVERLDPMSTNHLAVVLGQPDTRIESAAAAPVPAVIAAAPARPPVAAPARHRQPERRVATTAPAAAAVDTASTDDSAAGDGVLMVSSKPPCSILVDGVSTGLITPQREIALAAGTHKVTLVNAAENIKKTFSVQIKASKPTKLIENLMDE